MVREVPWAARGSNQSILKEINSEYLLEELLLKLQYFRHLIQRTDSLERTLMLETGKAKTNSAESSRGSVSDSKRPPTGVGAPCPYDM